jgi:hypothetical protein
MVHLEMWGFRLHSGIWKESVIFTEFIAVIVNFLNFVHRPAFDIKIKTTFRGQFRSLSSEKGVREAP